MLREIRKKFACRFISCTAPGHFAAVLFLVCFFLFVIPQGVYAEKEFKNALLYGCRIFLRYLPLVGLVLLLKLLFLKVKLALTWAELRRFIIQVTATIYTELLLLLIAYALLAGQIKEHIDKWKFIAKLGKNRAILDILFTNIILLIPWLYVVGVIVHIVFLHTYWTHTLKPAQKCCWSLVLAVIFPLILLLFITVGLFLNQLPQML